MASKLHSSGLTSVKGRVWVSESFFSIVRNMKFTPAFQIHRTAVYEKAWKAKIINYLCARSNLKVGKTLRIHRQSAWIGKKAQDCPACQLFGKIKPNTVKEKALGVNTCEQGCYTFWLLSGSQKL